MRKHLLERGKKSASIANKKKRYKDLKKIKDGFQRVPFKKLLFILTLLICMFVFNFVTSKLVF